MLCEKCGAEEASVKIVDFVEAGPKEEHLCPKCAVLSGKLDKPREDGSYRLIGSYQGTWHQLNLKKTVEDGKATIRCPFCEEVLSEETSI